MKATVLLRERREQRARCSHVNTNEENLDTAADILNRYSPLDVHREGSGPSAVTNADTTVSGATPAGPTNRPKQSYSSGGRTTPGRKAYRPERGRAGLLTRCGPAS